MKILAIIPAFNEEGNIENVVKEITALASGVDIVVVNDNSKDRTEACAHRAGAKVLNLPFNLGIGGAVQTGYQYAMAKGYDIALQIDGDGQHDVKFLESLVTPIKNNLCDMAIGSRFLPPYLGYRSSMIRRIGIGFFANLISFLIGQRVTDPTSGFRAVNKKLIGIFAQDYPLDFPEPEAIVTASCAKARILEVPVQMRQRLTGLSSIRYFKTFYYMIKVTCAILLRRIKTQKEKCDVHD
ncbi:MAG: glycosyltransferase family 2 protein [Candidatus Aceula meridiana]|nr:glycosyltransferase family 2 protein [Candidatus Aceula meridiana]